MIQIRPLATADADAIADIYAHYVQHTTATFDTEPPRSGEDVMMKLPFDGAYPAYVCVADGVVAGYCYAHPWKERHAYRYTLENTVYLHPDHTGKGYGRMLMERLIEACRDEGYHALVACITVPNEASIALHERLGFRRVSLFREVGRKFDHWLDVADYELIL